MSDHAKKPPAQKGKRLSYLLAPGGHKTTQTLFIALHERMETKPLVKYQDRHGCFCAHIDKAMEVLSIVISFPV